MRALIVAFVVLATAHTALACPRGARCVIEAPTIDEAPGPQRPVRLQIDHAAARDPWTFDAPKQTDDDKLPSFWKELRERAYEHVPRYRGDDDLTFTLSPVVVSGPAFDTVAGFGIAGDF